MKTTKRNRLFAALPAVLALVPARAAEVGKESTPDGLIILLLLMGVALVLTGIVGYVLSLVSGLGGAFRRAADPTTRPEKFVPYLEELDGAQLDVLQRIHAPAASSTLHIHDHAKEQLV